jgi:hypothetical protein
MVKHVEQALSSNASSRTEISGSRRRRGDPPGMVFVTLNPRPRGVEAVDVSIWTLEEDIFEAVEAVTAADVIVLEIVILSSMK